MALSKTAVSRRSAALLGASGFLAGVCNGMLGSGGGMILWFGLTKTGLCPKDKTFATGAAAVLVLSLVSALFYLLRAGTAELLTPALLPAAAGGALGAFFLGRCRVTTVKTIFALVLAVSGAILLFR